MRLIGDTRVYHWTEIQDSFRGADIFLGNGFSININSAMNYHSLFDKFLTYLSPCEQLVFKQFNSTNFEGIQNRLSNPLEVNSFFNSNGCEIGNALGLLKSGLLNSIKDLHPPFSQTDPNTIFQLSQKLDWFEDIFTTNYDIFLYHIVLSTLDRSRKKSNGVKRYQDFFMKRGSLLQFTGELIPGYKNIYYLHGALFIHKEGQQILKIEREGRCEELLDLIRLKIHIGHLPVFVSEGKSEMKGETISKSKYLSFCRSAFRLNRNPMAIYGFSFSDCDQHLIEDLNDHKRKLAIGLYLPELNDGKIQQKIKAIEKKLYKYRTNEIRYFDSRTLF